MPIQLYALKISSLIKKKKKKTRILGEVLVDVKGHNEWSGGGEVGLNSTKLVAVTSHNHLELVSLSSNSVAAE